MEIKNGSVMMVVRGSTTFRVTVIEFRGVMTLIETLVDRERFEVESNDLHPVEVR